MRNKKAFNDPRWKKLWGYINKFLPLLAKELGEKKMRFSPRNSGEALAALPVALQCKGARLLQREIKSASVELEFQCENSRLVTDVFVEEGYIPLKLRASLEVAAAIQVVLEQQGHPEADNLEKVIVSLIEDIFGMFIPL